jgi:isocitrate dehydrogenase (NAD+)
LPDFAMKNYEIVELLGDGISAELSESVHRIAEALPFGVGFHQVDLSVESRDRRGAAVYDEAVDALTKLRSAIKYPTVTDKESPNRVLRERCGFAVIHRPVMTFPGVENNFKRSLDVDVVRIATGGTYSDRGMRIGEESAVSIRVIERHPSRLAARYAFDLAREKGCNVVSTSKYTIQKAADGLFEEQVEDVAKRYPEVEYRRELFDALLAGVILRPQNYRVIVCPNEYGDFLSDMASGLIGSIGTGASGNFSFTDADQVEIAMFDPAGGTAPDIAGQDKCNPTAILLAFGMLLDHIDRYDLGHELRLALLGAIADGECTRDIGGKLGTKEFSRNIAERLRGRF